MGMESRSIYLMKRRAAELERLDMTLLPDFILSLFISTLPYRYDALEQRFRERDAKQSKTLSAVLAQYSQLVARRG